MSDLPFASESLPIFSKIQEDRIHETVVNLINKNKKKLDLIKSNRDSANFIESLEELDIELMNFWSSVNHMNSVVSNDKLRAAYEMTLPELVQYNLSIGQDKEIFTAYKKLLEQTKSAENNLFSKLLENKLRDFKLSGVELESEKKQEFLRLATELSNHSTKFSNNVMDSTDSWTYHIIDKKRLDGIPDDIIELAANRAKEHNQEGWLFGLDSPTYTAILKNAVNRELRATFHYAYATRASKKGPHDEKYDNTNEMYNILFKRHQKAKLLGYKNYAELSLASKMVKNPEQVLNFLKNLLEKAKPVAQKEWEELKLYAKSKDGIDNLKPWDVAYYSELQKNKLFNLSDEKLKHYFPLKKVLSGLFEILNRIYKIEFHENHNADTWHKDVCCYDVLYNNEVIGYIYLDLFSRLHKRNGAWMDESRVKCETLHINQLPVSLLTCNFTAPLDNKPALLTHYDVTTLFHEFGHCLHQLLTEIKLPSLSGINGVPWDAVELPSQIHENWCWLHDSLPLISEHHETGESLPEKYLNQLQKQKNYQSGLFLLRQLTFGLFDFTLHYYFHPDKGISQIQEVLDQVRNNVSLLQYADYDQFQHSFSHIFAGGYGAGYYSYLWAEVLSANCFQKFLNNGIFNLDTGLEFRDKILAKGGSIDFNKAVTDFCGSEIKIEPLLARYGVA